MSLTALKERTLKRYRLSNGKATLIRGGSFFFGLSFQPLEAAVDHIIDTDVVQALNSDGKVIGEDFQRVFSKETETINVKATTK